MFILDDYVSPTDQVRVRFSTSDLPNNAVTEAGVDDLHVQRLWVDCPTDLDGNGGTDVEDLVMLLLAWGPC